MKRQIFNDKDTEEYDLKNEEKCARLQRSIRKQKHNKSFQCAKTRLL